MTSVPHSTHAQSLVLADFLNATAGVDAVLMASEDGLPLGFAGVSAEAHEPLSAVVSTMFSLTQQVGMLALGDPGAVAYQMVAFESGESVVMVRGHANTVVAAVVPMGADLEQVTNAVNLLARQRPVSLSVDSRSKPLPPEGSAQ
ncbi:roadblock/LC7 domain-containing protein [Streptomyces sp. NPDC053474]|uniref:roadblock/LC7 domain-containing protein n=1 Tax=Streptomyces sp. NPDC053474 TaxID=3365704 RepID=UPI0037D4213B